MSLIFDFFRAYRECEAGGREALCRFGQADGDGGFAGFSKVWVVAGAAMGHKRSGPKDAAPFRFFT
jgi:hypothetical protein